MPRTFPALRDGPLRRRAALPLLLVCLALGSLPAGAVAGRETVRIDLGPREAIVPAIALAGERFVSAKSMAAALGASFGREGSGFRIETEGGAWVDFPDHLPGLARAGERVLSLGRDAIRRDGDLYVPESALPKLLALLDAAPEHDGGGGWVLTGAGPDTLRLEAALPEAPRRVEVAREEDGRFRVKVVASTPIDPPWRHRDVGSRLLAAIDAAPDPRGLVLIVTPGPDLEGLTASRSEAPSGFTVVARGHGRAAPVALAAARPAGPVQRVVIDPGHGGSEQGAVGPTGLEEKELVLDIAKRLAALLRAEGFDVLLTREHDVDLGLDERAEIANRWHADLFLSLHANASRAASARGAETYFLSAEATDDAARTLAALENDAASAAGSGTAAAGAGDDLPLILWDMAQREYLAESARLARTIQRRLNRLLGIADRGVRRAPFRVLVGATCPAVLVELGFVTNRGEESRLARSEYRQRLAEALRDAVRSFRAAAGAGAGP